MRETEAVTAAMREAEFERVQREGLEASLADAQVHLTIPHCMPASLYSLPTMQLGCQRQLCSGAFLISCASASCAAA